MPKAAIQKDNDPGFREKQVRRSGQSWRPHFPALYVLASECADYHALRRGVSRRAHSLHDFRAFLSAERVHPNAKSNHLKICEEGGRVKHLGNREIGKARAQTSAAEVCD